MNKNFKKTILLTFFLILFSINGIFAVGITPGRTTINFEPGLHKNIYFTILNQEHKPLSLEFFVKGEMTNYVKLEQKTAFISESETSKDFYYTINLPNKQIDPGMHDVEIIARVVPSSVNSSESFAKATLAVVTQLHIFSPYPGKYVDAELKVTSIPGQKINFLIPVTNRGNEDIENISAKINIYSLDDKKVETLNSNSFSLRAGESKEFLVNLDSVLPPATYKAVAEISYDGKKLNKQILFDVGKLAMQVTKIEIKNFVLGGVAKFNATVENDWGDDLKNVYLKIVVYNSSGGDLADFKSQVYDVPARSKKNMIAYWDTSGVKQGDYNGKVILKYGQYSEKSIEKEVQIKVSENDIEVVGLTGHVVSVSSGKFNLNNFLIIIIIVLVIINIVWFVVIKKLKNKLNKNKIKR